MDRLPEHSELARLLRAEVPPLHDERFAVTLAELARRAQAPTRRQVPLVVRLAAVAASVVLTTVGATYAHERLAPSPPDAPGPATPGDGRTDPPADDTDAPVAPLRRSDRRPAPPTSTRPADPGTPSTAGGEQPVPAEGPPVGPVPEQHPEEPGTPAPQPDDPGEDAGSGDEIETDPTDDGGPGPNTDSGDEEDSPDPDDEGEEEDEDPGEDDDEDDAPEPADESPGTDD